MLEMVYPCKSTTKVVMHQEHKLEYIDMFYLE